MTDERIAELQGFKTKDFTDCPVQNPEQLQKFKPKYSDAQVAPTDEVLASARSLIKKHLPAFEELGK